jgi:methionine-rich copper-binding protein CopC
MRLSNTPLPALAALAALAFAAPLAAHAELVRSTPAARASVAAPATLSVTFSDELVAAFSKIELTMTGHDMSVPVSTRLSRDRKTLIGTPQRALTKGAWSMRWTAATADGHRQQGTVAFQVK